MHASSQRCWVLFKDPEWVELLLEYAGIHCGSRRRRRSTSLPSRSKRLTSEAKRKVGLMFVDRNRFRTVSDKITVRTLVFRCLPCLHPYYPPGTMILSGWADVLGLATNFWIPSCACADVVRLIIILGITSVPLHLPQPLANSLSGVKKQLYIK